MEDDDNLDFIDKGIAQQEAERQQARDAHFQEYGQAGALCRLLWRNGVRAHVQKGFVLKIVIEEADFEGLEGLLKRGPR